MQASIAMPTTALQAQKVLQQAGLPSLNPRTIAAIVAKEGNAFLSALVEVAERAEPNEERKQYIASVISACVPATYEILSSVGVAATPLERVIDVSKKQGRDFSRAIQTLRKQGLTAETDPLRQYLVRLFQDDPRAVRVDDRQPVRAGVSGPSGDNALYERPRGNPSRSADEQHRRPEASSAPKRQPDPASCRTSGKAESDEERKFDSYHLYGGKASFCFSSDQTRRSDATIRIEAAMATGPRVYDWSEKASFQLTPTELPLVFGVLYGYVKRVELVGHGHENEKSLVIEEQGEKFFFSLRVKGKAVFAMPAPAKDVFPIMTLILSQMIKNCPSLPPNEIRALAKRVCDMYASSSAPSRQSNNA